MWKGGIVFSMVTFPISVIKASDDRQGIKLNILHSVCNTRIQEKKHCPEHGEIPASETVKGYEVAPGQFIQLTETDMESIAIDSGKALEVEQFVPAGSIGFAKGDYYLGTDKLGAPAYKLMHDAMLEDGVEAVTRVSFRGREQLATIRPHMSALVLTTHYWPDEIRSMEGLVPDVPARPAAELAMARQLIGSMTGPFDPAAFEDAYTSALITLINDKQAGKTIAAPAAPPPAAAVPDLMATLAASLASQKPKKRGKAAPAAA
jgi:DNA end-binding protein Ku